MINMSGWQEWQMQMVTALFAVNTGFAGVTREPVILEEG